MFNFFRKKPEPIQATPLYLDFHSHFLYGLDDGSKSISESIIMLQKMEEYGYTHLIMTPHVMGDFYKNSPDMILNKLDDLKEEVLKQSINLKLGASAEYYLDEWFAEKIRTKELLPFGSNYILFEISYVNEPRNLFETIFNLQIAGFQPVLAHPERYNFYHNRFEIYEEIVEKGCKLQLNMLSLIGYYGPEVKKIAIRLIDQNMAYFVGSDAHHQKHVDLLAQVLDSTHFAKVSSFIHNNEIIEYMK